MRKRLVFTVLGVLLGLAVAAQQQTDPVAKTLLAALSYTGVTCTASPKLKTARGSACAKSTDSASWTMQAVDFALTNIYGQQAVALSDWAVSGGDFTKEYVVGQQLYSISVPLGGLGLMVEWGPLPPP